MNEVLRLDTADPDRWARTVAAVRTAQDAGMAPAMKVTCSKCGTTLAAVGIVEGYGPLFTSSFEVPSNDTLTLNGRKVPKPTALSRMASHASITVTRGNVVLRDGAIALLDSDHDVDLLVRCRLHGDLVLDRADVVDVVRRNVRRMKVVTTDLRYRYLEPQPITAI